MTSEVYAIIPARAGSKGVPDKNIRSLAGLPLLAYSVKTALNATAIDRVFVSTDSPVYRDIATSHGAEAPFLRPEDIAGDKSSDLDVMQHFLNWLNDNGEPAPKYLVHLRPTTPLRSPAMVDQAIGMIDKHPEATALRSVHEMAETAYKCVEREGEFLVSAFTRNTEQIGRAHV